MVFLFFQMIIMFFAGKNMFGDLPEDLEAAKILEAHRQAKQAQATPQPQPYPFPPYGYPYPPQPGQVVNQPVVQEIDAKPIENNDKEGEKE
jgi:hypothetical protein